MNDLMKNLVKFIKENIQKKAPWEILWDMIGETAKGTALWDDSEEFEPKEVWEYWQDASGQGDDALVDELDTFFKNCAVVGWMSEESHEDCEKKVPKDFMKFIKDFITKHKPVDKYHTRFVDLTMWDEFDKEDNVTTKVAFFEKWTNDNGTDYPTWWIVVGME